MKSLVGTVSHMAPELLEHRPYKKSADVYAFAMVLWQMLSGELPYKTYTAPLQVVYDVVGLGLRPEIPSDTPEAVTALLEECWAAEPNDRPTFEEIVSRLEEMV
jgi:serine/threonine protein kinase